VKVSISVSDKKIEEGEAVLSGGVWMYTAMANAVNDNNYVITVAAYDLPGNETVAVIKR
jgi:hypothetical protein